MSPFEKGSGGRRRGARNIRGWACGETSEVIRETTQRLSASRYALMMKRFGQSDAGRTSFNRVIQYPKAGWR